eukprot:TRINITY_DN9082_c0_g1_i2.p1 TRINITY_DN9082_c0_g1~~TRINITY_DN9082_c0_g1_i2.p1  ORF type:complete len:181 (-),score=12.50 TRINITY_DN9082_c0_g1_i2:20-562(-)
MALTFRLMRLMLVVVWGVRMRENGSMIVHHVLSILIQGHMWYYAPYWPEAYRMLHCFQVFAWTELGTTLHKGSHLLPGYHTWAYKRHYQLTYLTCYLCCYPPIIFFLCFQVPATYPLVPVFYGIPSTLLHRVFIGTLVTLLGYWWYQALVAAQYVWTQLTSNNARLLSRQPPGYQPTKKN